MYMNTCMHVCSNLHSEYVHVHVSCTFEYMHISTLLRRTDIILLSKIVQSHVFTSKHILKIYLECDIESVTSKSFECILRVTKD
jgi:hypothetical protein